MDCPQRATSERFSFRQQAPAIHFASLAITAGLKAHQYTGVDKIFSSPTDAKLLQMGAMLFLLRGKSPIFLGPTVVKTEWQSWLWMLRPGIVRGRRLPQPVVRGIPPPRGKYGIAGRS